MKNRFGWIVATSVVTATFAAGACSGGGSGPSGLGGGGGGPGPTPTPTPPAATSCIHSLSVARQPLSVFSVPAGSVSRGPSSEGPSPFISGRILVKFASRTAGADTLARLGDMGARAASDVNDENTVTFAIPPNVDPRIAAESAARIAGVVSAQPIHARYLQDVTPNDPDYTNVKQWDMWAINMHCAWSLTIGSSAIKIAIIDTGYDAAHPDLAGKVVATAVFDKGNGTQDMGASIQDNDGHGTNVSGIAAADTNNGVDVAGTGYNTALIEARVFPYPSPSATPQASTADIGAAVTWAVAHGANVINLSLGGPCPDASDEQTPIENAIAAGVVVVAASGNGNNAGKGQATLDCPAGDPGVISAGASALSDTVPNDPATATETVASYSNFGSVSLPLDLVAPGGDPTSVSDNDDLHWILNLYSQTAPPAGHTLAFFAGTSMATPHIAAAAALMKAFDSGITPAQVRTTLDNTADDIGSTKQGHGRLNVDKALCSLPGAPTPICP